MGGTLWFPLEHLHYYQHGCTTSIFFLNQSGLDCNAEADSPSPSGSEKVLSLTQGHRGGCAEKPVTPI